MRLQPRHHNAQRGAASIEAALVLPVLAMLLLGLLFLSRWYAARGDVRRLARQCALAYASGGCKQIPLGCDGVLAPGLDRGVDRAEAARLRHSASAGDTFGVLDLPLISDALDTLFGVATRARAEQRVRLPWGSAAAPAHGDFVALCNERPRDVAAAIEQVFCDRVPAVRCR